MYVFRDGRHAVSGPLLRSQLADAIRSVPASAATHQNGRGGLSNELIEALLRAGELECALADAQHPGEQRLALVTDALAANLVGGPTTEPAALLAQLPPSVPETLTVSPPEGFAFYALHPSDVASLAAKSPANSHHAVVIGIRTIGLTLSAVVMAELRKRGKHACRISVRPDGHPYDRRTTFTDEQKSLICRYRNANADFLIVDEGPGMSGSSFLSVADALIAACVPRERITLLCSREPDVSQLRARDGQQRWPQYRAIYMHPNSFLPAEAKVYVAGGIWRAHFLAREADWPESWLAMERLKFLSPDKRTLFKFEGLGRYGRAVHERACRLHDSGFGPRCATPENGFGIYPVEGGRLLCTYDLSPELLKQLARYCAMRAREFGVSSGHTRDGHVPMEQMARFNFEQEFGESVSTPDLPQDALASSALIIADGRMQPHEWLLTGDGRLLKLDGAEHGDDHFFPGPTDIAWDLAGAIVEWRMNSDAQKTFLREYRHASGDDVEPRIVPFLFAYSSFRMGYCKMAAESVRGADEEPRLLRAFARYRDYLAQLVGLEVAPAPVRDRGHDAARQPREVTLLDGPSAEALAA